MSRWYLTIAQAYKNQQLITVNMVRMYTLKADTKVISMGQPHAIEHNTLTSKQFHACTGCYINKTFIFFALFINMKYTNSQLNLCSRKSILLQVISEKDHFV